MEKINRQETIGPFDEHSSILIGNGMDIQFGGDDYRNDSIIKRAMKNSESSILSERGYDAGCSKLLELLWSFSEKMANGAADSLCDISIGNIGERLKNFKRKYINSRRNEIGKIGIEDYLFIFEVVCILYQIDNPDKYEIREMLKLFFLDSIYNNGLIQNIYHDAPDKLKMFLAKFKNIYTTNYGNSLEKFLERKIFYLHGAFHILDDRYRPDSFLSNVIPKDDVIIPVGEHLKSSAILSDDGMSKEFQIEAYHNTNNALKKFVTGWRNDPQIHDDIESWKNNDLVLSLKKAIHYVDEHPQSLLHENMALQSLQNESGTIYILGLSPFNDNHIFNAISKNLSLNKVVYCYFDENECSRVSKVLQRETLNISFLHVKKIWNWINE